jgi:hypothetical protein
MRTNKFEIALLLLFLLVHKITVGITYSSALIWPINRSICSLFNRYRRERIVRIALLE